MSGKVVRDPIHGNIGLESPYLELVDAREFQRLRGIKQNGLCYLVYPAMNSTRFEHSLGTYHLGGLVSGKLGLKDRDQRLLRAACLLHDVGHGPFSHTFDGLFEEHGLDHEDESCRLISKTGLSDILEDAGISRARVTELIKGEGRLGKLLSSDVDVDKMDYLVRDAYYAGVAYGVTDVERLLDSIVLDGDDVVIEYGGLEAAESLLINRNMMYQTVYRHHTKRIAEAMLQHGVDRLVESGTRVQDLFRMDDIELVHLMRSSRGYVKDMIGRIEGRMLFKSVFTEPLAALTEDGRDEIVDNRAGIEDRIARDLKVKRGYLMLDYPEASMSEYGVKVKTLRGLKSIGEVSALAKSLESSETEKLSLSIYARLEDRGKFRNFRPERYFAYTQMKISGYV